MSYLNPGILILALCAASSLANPLHAQTPREVNAADEFAQPLLIVPPRFPGSIPAEFTKVDVVITGTIGADGKLRDATVRAPDGSADFEKDLREVTRMWRFIPATDRSACEPKDAPGKVVVTFEINDAKEAIYVTVPDKFKAAPSTGEYVPIHKTPQGLGMKLARQITYPYEALRGGGIEGYVLALVQIAPDASLKKATILAATPNDIFNRTVLRAIQRATFTRGDMATADHAACIVIPFSFCVSGPAGISMESECISGR